MIMNFKQTLGSLKTQIDKEIAHQFDAVIGETKKEDKLLAEALMQIKKIALAGGKRIRGALVVEAYFGVGGKERKKIIKVAAAIELVHLFLLVHDDIIDRGDLRHGQVTLHKILLKKYQKKMGEVEAQHFGNSIAIIAGGMLHALANKIILEAGFPNEITVRALLKLQEVVGTTIVGQSQDIVIEHEKNVSPKQVLTMCQNKTARYTFEGPLQIGVMLGGCKDKKTLKQLSLLALPLGIAFQIQDDMLGVFGEKSKIGKSVASDIEEGKQSLLVVKAREFGSEMQKKKINSILGRKNLTQKEILEFQNVLIETGSFEFSKNLTKKYLQTAKKEVEKLIVKKNSKDFLLGMVEYLEEREV